MDVLEKVALSQPDLSTQEGIVEVVIDHLASISLDLEGELLVPPSLMGAATPLKVGVLTDPEKRDYCIVSQRHLLGLQFTTYRVDAFGKVYTVEVFFNGHSVSHEFETDRYETALRSGDFHPIKTPIAALGGQLFLES